jgi:hypothetical protein
MNDIKIIDNLLPLGYANQIEEDLLRVAFPWYYVKDVTNDKYGNNSGLVHLAFDFGTPPSEWYPFIRPMVYSIEQAEGCVIQELLRIRIGFLTKIVPDVDYKYNTPHVDFLVPHHTACYYVNDSDGDTVLFDNFLSDVGDVCNEETLNTYGKTADFNVVKRCAPRKNSAFIFDGHRFHSSTNPQHHDRRLVITVNYTV